MMSSSYCLGLFVRLLAVICLLAPAVGAATTIRMQTSLGAIDVELYDGAAPKTVANFLLYANNGAYNNAIIHRSMPGFVIQGGGYTYSSNNTIAPVMTYPPVANEFSSTRSNVRGTIAMAKLGSDPDSATSQWFFNLDDNSSNLDVQNAGFTVFGKVIGDGMKVVDAIAALPVVNAGAGTAFTNLPVIPPVNNNTITKSNLVLLNVSIGNPAATNDSDRVFAYLEQIYPQYISPANSLAPNNGASSNWSGYYYRYYATTNSYVATSNGSVYYMGPATGNQIISIGSVQEWLQKAAIAGY